MLSRKIILGCLAVLFSISIVHAQIGSSPSASSYLGGSSTSDYVTGTEIQADGTVVIAANISSANPGGVSPILLNGSTSSTSGAILRLSADGKSVLSVTRLANEVRDISLDSSGNIYVAARASGVIKLNSTASSVLWTAANGGSAERVDAAPNGYSVALKIAADAAGWSATGAGTIYVYDANGGQVGSFAGHNRTMDVAIDSVSQSVYGIGYQNKNSPYNPVQVCYVKSHSYTGTQKWKAYDWSGAQVDSPNENNMADTRGLRIEMGDDGYLYCLFMSAGGNHIFRRDPFDLLKAVTIVGGDKYHEMYNTKSEHKTFFGKYNPSTGAYIQGQQWSARLTTGEGNTAWCEKGNIKADSAGRVIIVGSSGSGGGTNNTNLGLPFSFNPVASTEYGGGPFVLVMSPNFATRLFCGRINSSGYMHAAGIRVVNSKVNVVFGGHASTTPLYRINAIQNTASTANDGMFAVVLDGGTTTNPAPSVSITSPANGATYNAPGSVAINAAASDSNGTVSKVEFFSGTTLLGTDTSSPYSVSWNSVAAGNYSLTAKATDNGAASTTSSAVNISVTASASSSSYALNATADSYVRDDTYAGSNFGTSTTLQTKMGTVGYTRYTYLKFDITGVNGNISTAKLRLYGKVSGTTGLTATHAYGVTTDSWTETGVTWNNKPAPVGTSLSNVTVTSTTGAWYEWNVATFLSSEKSGGQTIVTVVLKHDATCTPNNDFNSREASTNKPQLVITTQ